MKTLLQSDENYYNSKRSNNQSFQNFIRILIVIFLGAFISNIPWNSLQVPALAFAGAALLIISILLNIYTYPVAQRALDEAREATHKTFNENDITYIDEIPRAYKKLSRLTKTLIVCLTLSILICPTSYIVENTLEPKEVTKMAKKPQSTEQPKQPNRNIGERKEERLWDTPSRPITPTPAETPAQPAQPAPESAKPVEQPAKPAPKPQSDTKK